MSALLVLNHRKRLQKAPKTRETQPNKPNSSSTDERYLGSDSNSSTHISTDPPANPTIFGSIIRRACQPSGTNRSRSMTSKTTTMQAEPIRNTNSSLCRDVAEHIQPRSHIGLGERLKEAWKSALPNKEKCEVCYKDTPIARLIITPCDHKYCPNCICKMVSLAMREKSLFPVRCCGKEIPAKLVASVLHYREKKAYLNRVDEQEVPPSDRWYCPHPTCGLWIHPRNLTTRSKPLKCPHCRVGICFNCRDMAHEARECAVDETLGDILAVARRQRWQRCYRCHTLVERTDGCTHMRCTCSAEFCYSCGGPYPCHCRGTDTGVAREDAGRLREGGDLDLTTIVAAMERAEQEEQTAEALRRIQTQREGIAAGATR